MLKKAVSPLIATVLLLAFAVSLGAIVLNFSEDTTNELKDTATQQIERGITCSIDLPVRILEIENRKYICYNRTGSNNLEVIIENQGGGNAKGVRIFLLDNEDNPVTRDILTPLGGHNRTKYNVSVLTTDAGGTIVFPPNKVIISPIIQYTDTTIDICTDNRIDIEEIERCS